jgi:hypothetical protein
MKNRLWPEHFPPRWVEMPGPRVRPQPPESNLRSWIVENLP